MARPDSSDVGPDPAARVRSRTVVGLVVLLLLVGAAFVIAASGSPADDSTSSTAGDQDEERASREAEAEVSPLAAGASIWLSADELDALPVRGRAWDAVVELAEDDWGDFDLDDNDGEHDIHTLAGALVAARTSDIEMIDRVTEALEEVQDARIGDLLPLARNLGPYVIAADLIGYHTEDFESWLEETIDTDSEGRAGIDSLRESAIKDPSNHGAHARASVLSAALYLDDEQLVSVVADRFRDWLGRSSDGFVWKELWWQADPDEPVGINRPGSEIDGLDVDGVLPEEQRRSGRFTEDPERENYVWEALQGSVVTAELLHRAGYPAWEWEDRAILRAFEWLHDVNDYPAEGDDVWQSWLVNARYGTDYPVSTPTRPGKNLGFTDWTHAEPRVIGG